MQLIFSFRILTPYLFTGLFHGKDVRFGSSISHSHHKTNRKWKPNVQNKRLWSDSLDEWIRFKITAAAIKAVDNYGGIDNYMMRLDERLVQDSNYLIKVRGLIATALYHKGELNPGMAKRLGYDKVPPAKLEGLAFPRKINERKGDYRRGPLAKFQGLGEHPAVPPKKSTGEQADLHELPLMEAAAAEGAQ